MNKTRFLIINVTRIGDTLFAIPAIRAIYESHANAEINVLAHPNRYEVLQNLPYINKVGKITKNSAKFLKYFTAKRYDYAIVYGFDKELIKYALKAADKVIAFSQDDERINKKLFYVAQIPQFQCEHAVLQFLRLPKALNYETDNLRLEYHPTRLEIENAKKTLGNFASAKPLIGLQIASFHTMSFRDWPHEYFLELCQKILVKYPGAKFVIFGGEYEKKRADTLAKQIGENAISIAGRLSVRQSAACMGLIDLYIGIDTGPTHIMSCFDTPMVAMYHANSPSEHTGPINHPNAFLINHPKGHVNDPQISMSDILVETVFAEVLKALGDKF